MLFRTELLFIILLYFSVSQSHAQEIFTASFEASVTGSADTTTCQFTLHFTDVEVLKTSTVKCGRIKKTMIINNYIHELPQAMFIIRDKSLQRFYNAFFNLSNSF